VITCDFCKKKIRKSKGCGTGYAIQPSGHRTCYKCCAEVDRKYMKRHGQNTLYWDGTWVTNWPGSLKFKPHYIQKGRHNIAGTRVDVWFEFNGKVWWGVQYGEMTQILRCKETNGKKRVYGSF